MINVTIRLVRIISRCINSHSICFALVRLTTMTLVIWASSAAVVFAGVKMATVDATSTETHEAWRSYWKNASTLKTSTQFPHQACFEEAAKTHAVPATLALAVSRGESNFDPRAVSSADAVGMMQILWPVTAKHLGITDRELLYEPCINIEAGVRYLREMLDRYDNNVHLTLAAYNYGPGRIKPGAEASTIPDGAAWYSGYIYNHLRYVLGTANPQAERSAPARYEDEQRLQVIVFNAPDKAAAFVEYLRGAAPIARLDWFDNRLGRWSVDLLYQDEAEKGASKKALEASGFKIQEQ